MSLFPPPGLVLDKWIQGHSWIQIQEMCPSSTFTEKVRKGKKQRVKSALRPTTADHSKITAPANSSNAVKTSCQTAFNWTQTENLLCLRRDVPSSMQSLLVGSLLTSACRCELLFVCRVTATPIYDQHFTVTFFNRSQQHR